MEYTVPLKIWHDMNTSLEILNVAKYSQYMDYNKHYVYFISYVLFNCSFFLARCTSKHALCTK